MNDATPDDPAIDRDDGSDHALLASLADDFAARYRRGERPDLDDFARDHPGQAEQIRELFPAMLLMEEPGIGALADHALGGERLGATVGRYKLLERLGEGGFGVVFLAEQQHPVRRRVALKVIKPGLDTAQVIARFQAERQALALMDHENIARVLDAGATDTGRPYFVMELVHGVPITEYCEQNRLAPDQRLELFVRVCRAIQHAHTKGIIHRDLKPTNVLVAVQDGVAVPKVIDFGVAKATAQQQLTDGTLFTNVAQIVGTPLYMSPEQAEMSGLDVDTRSDVYSLGVLLYELLTGTTPVDKDRLKQAGFDEVRRIIREEEPPRPSTRISTLSGRLPAASAGRRGDLKKLGQLVRGELDWIVMKCLEKDRARRYETVSGLGTDVQRYLNDEAVQACPPSATYRAQKFMRKHKGPVVAASLIALVLVAGIIGTTWGIARTRVAAAEKEVALISARSSAREAQDQRYLKLLSQARSQRISGRAGQRFDALKTIELARQIRVTPELRDEAAAALVLPDIEIAREWDDPDPTGVLTVSFDGETIRYARVSQQGAVSICRVSDGGEVVVTKLPAYGRSGIRGPWWSDDRRFVAYGHSGADNTESAALRVWKLDGQTPTVFVDDPEGVNSAAFAFHSGGGKFAVGHVASDVSVYDLDTGKRKKLPVGKVKALAFHPRDDRLAITWGNSVRILDSKTGVVLKRLQSAQMAQEIRCVAWHPDGRRVAMGCRDFKIHVFDADSAAEILPPWDNGSEIETIAFNHSGDLLLSHDWSQETRLWDVATGRALLTTPRDFSADVMTFSADDQYVGFSRVSRDGGKIQVWRLACGREVRALSGSGSGEVLKGRVTDGSGRILAVGFPDRLCFFDTGTGEELATVPVRALPFAFDPAGGWLTGGIRGVMLWRLRSDPGRSGSFRVGPRQLLVSGDGIQVGENPITHDRFTIGVDGLALWPGGPDPRRAGLLSSAPPQPPVSGFGTGLWGFSGASRDGKVLAICESTSAILIHRDRAGRPLTLGPQPGMGSSRVSPDGKWVATFSCWAAGDSKPVRIWDGRDGRHVLDLPLTGALSCGGFSPDGRWLATAENGQSQLWEVGTWRKIRPFPGDFAFSADSQLMAVNDVVGSLRLVKTESGEEVARVTGPELVRYNSLCFTADGTRLIASGKATYVWDLRLIREQLREMGLDWDWPPFPPAVPGTPGRLHLTVDTGSSTQQGSGAAIPRPLEPAPEPDRSK